MKQVSIDKYHAAQALIADGMKVEDAAKKQSMSMATYYGVKKELSKSQGKITKIKRPYKKMATFIDIPLKTQSTNVAIVVCQPNQIKDILRGLQ